MTVHIIAVGIDPDDSNWDDYEVVDKFLSDNVEPDTLARQVDSSEFNSRVFLRASRMKLAVKSLYELMSSIAGDGNCFAISEDQADKFDTFKEEFVDVMEGIVNGSAALHRHALASKLVLERFFEDCEMSFDSLLADLDHYGEIPNGLTLHEPYARHFDENAYDLAAALVAAHKSAMDMMLAYNDATKDFA